MQPIALLLNLTEFSLQGKASEINLSRIDFLRKTEPITKLYALQGSK